MLQRICFVIIIERLFQFLLFWGYDSAVDLTLGCKLESSYNKYTVAADSTTQIPANLTDENGNVGR